METHFAKFEGKVHTTLDIEQHKFSKALRIADGFPIIANGFSG